MNEEKDRAILVGLQLNDGSSFEHNLEELESLCQACDIEPVFNHHTIPGCPAPGALHRFR